VTISDQAHEQATRMLDCPGCGRKIMARVLEAHRCTGEKTPQPIATDEHLHRANGRRGKQIMTPAGKFATLTAAARYYQVRTPVIYYRLQTDPNYFYL